MKNMGLCLYILKNTLMQKIQGFVIKIILISLPFTTYEP